jgi:hypothetical protein
MAAGLGAMTPSVATGISAHMGCAAQPRPSTEGRMLLVERQVEVPLTRTGTLPRRLD